MTKPLPSFALFSLLLLLGTQFALADATAKQMKPSTIDGFLNISESEVKTEIFADGTAWHYYDAWLQTDSKASPQDVAKSLITPQGFDLLDLKVYPIIDVQEKTITKTALVQDTQTFTDVVIDKKTEKIPNKATFHNETSTSKTYGYTTDNALKQISKDGSHVMLAVKTQSFQSGKFNPDVSACGHLIGDNTVFTQTADIWKNTTGDCIVFEGVNQTFNGGGFKLLSNGTSGNGIYTQGYAQPHITNAYIDGFGANGILYAYGSEYGTVNNTYITNSHTMGIWEYYPGTGNYFNNITINGSLSEGLLTIHSYGSRYNNIKIYNSTDYAVMLSAGVGADGNTNFTNSYFQNPMPAYLYDGGYYFDNCTFNGTTNAFTFATAGDATGSVINNSFALASLGGGSIIGSSGVTIANTVITNNRMWYNAGDNWKFLNVTFNCNSVSDLQCMAFYAHGQNIIINNSIFNSNPSNYEPLSCYVNVDSGSGLILQNSWFNVSSSGTYTANGAFTAQTCNNVRVINNTFHVNGSATVTHEGQAGIAIQAGAALDKWNITNNTFIITAPATTGITLSASVTNFRVIGNNITASIWINNSGTNISFNDTTSGNIYYYSNGTIYSPASWATTNPPWTTSGNATTYPLNATTAPAGYWVGAGQDFHPYLLLSILINSFNISYPTSWSQFGIPYQVLFQNFFTVKVLGNDTGISSAIRNYTCTRTDSILGDSGQMTGSYLNGANVSMNFSLVNANSGNPQKLICSASINQSGSLFSKTSQIEYVLPLGVGQTTAPSTCYNSTGAASIPASQAGVYFEIIGFWALLCLGLFFFAEISIHNLPLGIIGAILLVFMGIWLLTNPIVIKTGHNDIYSQGCTFNTTTNLIVQNQTQVYFYTQAKAASFSLNQVIGIVFIISGLWAGYKYAFAAAN